MATIFQLIENLFQTPKLIPINNKFFAFFKVILLLKLFVKTGNGSDFCESFKENNYRIDSVLSLDYHNLFLFIDSDYWPIDISSSLFGTDVRLLSTDSQTTFLFGSHYTMTFVTVYDKKQIIGLFSSFEEITYWRTYDETNPEHRFTLYIQETISPKEYNWPKNPVISFRLKDSEIFGSIEKHNKIQNKNREIRFFSLKWSLSDKLELKEYDLNEIVSKFGEHVKKLYDIRDDQQMIGIHQTNANDLGFLLVFSIEDSIQYCFSQKGCQKSDLKVMIECKKSCNLITGLIMMTIVLAFLTITSVIIIFIVFLRFLKTPKETSTSSSKKVFTTGANSMSSIVTVDTTTGEPLKQKVQKK